MNDCDVAWIGLCCTIPGNLLRNPKRRAVARELSGRVTTTRYRTVAIDGLHMFYRAAGRSDGPAVLLLHGCPWSSRMWQPLIDRLADRYRMVTPDYPGFGHSDALPADSFDYTFDHITDYVERSPTRSASPAT